MTVELKPLPQNKIISITAPASKSHMQRLLICSALSDGKTVIQNPCFCDDTIAMAEALCSLGAKITLSADSCEVKGLNFDALPNSAFADCKESATVYRFFLPLICALGVNGTVTGSKALAARPLSPLYEELSTHGVNLSENGVFPMSVSGKLFAGKYSFHKPVSSQFISALLITLPLLNGDSVLEASDEESRPYIELTISVLRDFGIDITRTANGYDIKGNRRPASCGEYTCEGDWSNSAVLLASGAITDNTVTVKGLNYTSTQGDKAICDILRKFGANVDIKPDCVTVQKGKLHGISIDAGDIPDLVPVLAVIACAASGETHIYNASRLKYKESDRLSAITDELTLLGASIKHTDSVLIINGNGTLQGGTVSSHGDHRISEACALASLICKSPVTLHDCEAVSKAYPAFFDDFAAFADERG